MAAKKCLSINNCDNINNEKEVTPFERMAEDITKIRDALNRLNNLGISGELMEIYIAHKTKLARFKINAVLDAQKEFLENAITKK